MVPKADPCGTPHLRECFQSYHHQQKHIAQDQTGTCKIVTIVEAHPLYQKIREQNVIINCIKSSRQVSSFLKQFFNLVQARKLMVYLLALMVVQHISFLMFSVSLSVVFKMASLLSQLSLIMMLRFCSWERKKLPTSSHVSAPSQQPIVT